MNLQYLIDENVNPIYPNQISCCRVRQFLGYYQKLRFFRLTHPTNCASCVQLS